MADITSLTGKVRWLPPAAKEFLRRRFAELLGIVLMAAGLAFCLSVMTYNPGDPSLNKASDEPVRNLLGNAGAITGDLVLQSVGLAGLAIGVVLIAWGWQAVRDTWRGRAWLRLALLPLAVVMLAITLAALPRLSGWPLMGGLGGASGDLLLTLLADGTGLGATIVALTALALAFLLLFFSLGLPLLSYVIFGQRVQQGVGASGNLIHRLLTRFGVGRRDSEESGQRRAERTQQQRAEQREPRFTDDDLDDDVEIAAPPRNAERRAAPVISKPARTRLRKAAQQGTLDLNNERYTLPSHDLLQKAPASNGQQRVNDDSLQKNARLLETVLDDFGVKGEIQQVRPGPVVTLYEVEPAPGTKTSRVVGLADDVARSMSAVSVRIAVVPGRSVIGIELPNRIRETVVLRELLETAEFERTAAKLALVLGKDIGGTPVVVDLARMPHLLIAGTTGSGKSVAINTMVLSLIYRLSPDQCKFIMIDPKMLELSVYDGIPHLLSPVVTDPRKAIVALKWTVREMEQRYRAMSKLGVRNIEGYNMRVAQARENGETLMRKVQTGFDPDSGAPVYEEEIMSLDPLPFIVVVVDEMADLMLVAGKDIEAAIQRLSQMARAAGIHIIMATQRPSVDVITGTIKANFPSRVSFHVTSKIDSRTILGETGAEQLLGQGDMLYMAHGGRITRIHGPLVTDREVESVVRFLKEQGSPTYIDDVTRDDEEEMAPDAGTFSEGSDDGLYDQAVALVCREGKASTSFVQRYLQIGYNRAARIIERMEKEGVVSAANRVGKREVLARNIDRDE
ncbi:MAG TPA: DNA translocase FtsK 4TM domain-containing protein [Dongiaceae bacterium]